MYSPHKYACRIGNIGSSLPDPFPSFGLEKIHFRRGGTSLIAGAPGSFKSVLALNMLASWARQGVSSLYFSADCDEFTSIKRLAGIITNENLDTVERRMINGDHERYEKALATLDGVAFEYEQMGFEDLVIHVKSYEAVYGAYPDVIFIDNLIDFVSSPSAWEEMIELIRDLDGFSKEIKSHVCILHHAKLGGKDEQKDKDRVPGQPPADWEIQGRVTQIPRLALTVGAWGMTLKVACVKNTNGPQYRDASRWMDFRVYDNMQVNNTHR
jgi:KaiC/GvpD/RAD55 family RecA-like ATPase